MSTSSSTRRRKLGPPVALLTAIWLVASAAGAQGRAKGPPPYMTALQPSTAEDLPRVEIHADLQNLVLLRNDSDFDRTRPTYDAYGQSVGAFATLLRPKVTWHVQKNLRLYYEAELGLNFWSRNNPDEPSQTAPGAFLLKHREVYSQGEFLEGRTGFKAGYQYFRDTTGLFVGHWMGAASAFYAWNDASRASVFFGQIPDLTYDGIKVAGDQQVNTNFRRDIFVFGPRTDVKLGNNAAFAAAIHVLYDNHLVDQTRWLVAPNMQIDGTSGAYSGFVGGVLQVGRFQHAALGGKDQNVFAWAAQAHGSANWDPAQLAVNVLALSPDDQAEGNTRNGAFTYSSKSRSATIILTEDELRNWYDQLDRRMGRFEGGFWTHRAGLLIGDVKGTWIVTKVFRPALVVGAASVLNKKNAMDKSFVGVETDVDLEFRASEKLAAHLVGGLLVPGGAGGVLLNKINLQATDPIWTVVGSLMARY
jgi:hypothetical protein